MKKWIVGILLSLSIVKWWIKRKKRKEFKQKFVNRVKECRNYIHHLKNSPRTKNGLSKRGAISDVLFEEYNIVNTKSVYEYIGDDLRCFVVPPFAFLVKEDWFESDIHFGIVEEFKKVNKHCLRRRTISDYLFIGFDRPEKSKDWFYPDLKGVTKECALEFVETLIKRIEDRIDKYEQKRIESQKTKIQNINEITKHTPSYNTVKCPDCNIESIIKESKEFCECPNCGEIFSHFGKKLHSLYG